MGPAFVKHYNQDISPAATAGNSTGGQNNWTPPPIPPPTPPTYTPPQFYAPRMSALQRGVYNPASTSHNYLQKYGVASHY